MKYARVVRNSKKSGGNRFKNVKAAAEQRLAIATEIAKSHKGVIWQDKVLSIAQGSEKELARLSKSN